MKIRRLAALSAVLLFSALAEAQDAQSVNREPAWTARSKFEIVASE